MKWILSAWELRQALLTESIPGQVISKTQKMVFDDSSLNTQHYKVEIRGKVELSRERSSALL